MIEQTQFADLRTSEVVATIRSINQAWLAGRFDDLDTLLHQDVVFASPDSSGRAEGREACVATYREFSSQARIGWFDDQEWQVDFNGDIAVASYVFELSYEMGGELLSERGRDIWVLRRDAVGWSGVWRTITQGEGD